MALRKVKGNIERMFDKNLTDLVRGIRNNKDNEVSDSHRDDIFSFKSLKARFSVKELLILTPVTLQLICIFFLKSLLESTFSYFAWNMNILIIPYVFASFIKGYLLSILWFDLLIVYTVDCSTF